MNPADQDLIRGCSKDDVAFQRLLTLFQTYEQKTTQRIITLLADLAHDLRTPLATMKINLYLAQHAAKLSHQAKHHQRLDEQLDLLGQIIENLLTLARLDHANALTLETLDLNALLKLVWATLEPKLQAKNQRIALQLDPQPTWVQADSQELSQAIWQVLVNALQYSPTAAVVTLITAHTATAVHLVVQDTGLGISPDALPHIFEPFYREDPARAGNRSGLGLAIAKTVIDAHHGTIEVTSTLGTGSRFTISLPKSRN